MSLDPIENSSILGQKQLKKAFRDTSDPLRAVEEFQRENEIMLPSLKPMLPLLDLHGVKRLEFHQSVLDELRERLRQQTEKLGKSNEKHDKRKLQELLVRSFRFIKVPVLQPVVMAVLKNVNNLDGKILKMLISDKQIYNACDISVKRQIWLDDSSLFGDEVSPLLQQYIQEKEKLLTDPLDVDAPFYTTTPKHRRQNKIIQQLVEKVGDQVMLYETIVQFLRTLFLKTKNVHYCSLRVEFLMALHDEDVHDITNMDQAHKFTWCLDACIREQAVDPKRARELQNVLENIKSGQEHVLADISMVLCDPHAIHFLATSTFKILNHLITIEALPRGNSNLVLILRCLNLGLHSWDIINSSVYREPRLQVKIFTKFLPIMMTILVEDMIKLVGLPEGADNNEAITNLIESGSLPDSFHKFIAKDRLAAVLARHLSHFRLKFVSSKKQLPSRAQI